MTKKAYTSPGIESERTDLPQAWACGSTPNAVDDETCYYGSTICTTFPGGSLRRAVALGRRAAAEASRIRYSPTSTPDRLRRHRVLHEPASAGKGWAHGSGFRTAH
jgi:hypothetical protein